MNLYYFDIYFSYNYHDEEGLAVYIVNNLDEKSNKLIQLGIENSKIKSNDLFWLDVKIDVVKYNNVSKNIYIKKFNYQNEYIKKYNFISCFYPSLLKYKFKDKIFNESELIMDNLLKKFLNKNIYDKLESNKYSLIDQHEGLSLHKLYAHGTNAYVLKLLKESNNYTLIPIKKIKNVISGEGAIIETDTDVSIYDFVSCTYIRNFYVPLFYSIRSSTLWDENDGCDLKKAKDVKGFLFTKDNIDLFTKKCKEINKIKNILNKMTEKEYNEYNELSHIPIVCIGSCNTYWDGDPSISRKLGWRTSNETKTCEVAIAYQTMYTLNPFKEILVNDLKIELIATNLENIKIVEKLLPSHIKVLPFELVEYFIYIHTLKYLI